MSEPSVRDEGWRNLASGEVGCARWGVQNYGYWSWWAEGPTGGTRSGAATKATCIKEAKACAASLNEKAVKSGRHV